MTSAVNNQQAWLEGLGMSSQAAPARRNDEMGSDQFLELMLTQLKNQDPLKPMENGEFLAQIAQFSTVTGVNELNSSFLDLTSAMQSNQALQASTLIGRAVLVPSDEVVHQSGADVSGTLSIPSAATAVTVSVYDQAGQLVKTIPLGGQSAGDVGFSWDGMTDSGGAAPAGTYKIKAEATLDGEGEAIETFIYDQVDSVDLGHGKGIRVNLARLGTAEFSDVIQIR